MWGHTPMPSEVRLMRAVVVAGVRTAPVPAPVSDQLRGLRVPQGWTRRMDKKGGQGDGCIVDLGRGTVFPLARGRGR